MNQGPQPLKKEDDWVRGNQLDLGRRVADADPSGDRVLWSMLYLGQSAVRLMKGIADAKDIGQVMGYIVAQCEQDVQSGARAMLAIEDTTSKEYRDLHFNTRVSAAIIGRLNQLVENGMRAGQELNSNTQGQ